MSTEACDFGTLVDPQHRKYQCKYCSKVVTSLTRLKCHLGGIRGEVIPCPEVPVGVREMLRTELLQKRFGNVIKNFEELNLPTLPLKRNRCDSPSKIVKQESIQTPCSGTSTNPNPETHFAFPNNVKDSAFPIRQVGPQLNETQKCTGGFLYGTGVDSLSKIVKQKSIQTPCSGTSTNPNPEMHFTFANTVKDSAFRIRQVDPPFNEAQKCIGRFFYETGIDSPSKIVKQESNQTPCSETSTNLNPETHVTFANNVKDSAFPIRQVDPPLNKAQKCIGRFFYGTGVDSPSKIVKQESIQMPCSGTSTNPNPETHYPFANNVKDSAFPIRQVDPPLNKAQKCTGRFFYETEVDSPSKIVKQESIQTPCSGTSINPNPEMHFTLANNEKDSAFPIGQVDPPLNEAQKCIGRFFYETGVDFEVAKSPSFRKMIKSINGSVDIPTYHELKGRVLQEAVKEMQNYTSNIKNVWAATGCSILLDGWVDSEGRKLLIILVDCPSGTIFHQCADISSIDNDVVKKEAFLRKVIEEVGVDNLVQIVTYSTSSFMEDVIQRVNEKCKTYFWTVSASHCIELMLRKFETMKDVNEILSKAKSITQFVYDHDSVLKLLRDFCPNVDELMKPSKIRSIVPFLTLENMFMEKRNLQRMFLSPVWKTLECAKTGDGQRVVDLVGDKTFWEGALMVLKATIPLVNVLKLISSSNKPQMGSIYDTIDQAKDTIKLEFKNKKSQYVRFWEAIDEIWNKHLHSPLHAAGYFLNPSIFYSSDFYDDAEVSCGFCCCIVRMTADSGVQDLIVMQIQQYRMGKGLFGVGSKDPQLENIDPAIWWSKYGRECPQLQRLAIRILNQTCNGASKYNLKRTLAEALLTQGRNKTEQARLKDLVFVHYNMYLQNFWADENNDLSNVEVDPMDDWIVRRQPSTVIKNGEPPVIDLESEESATSKV